MDAEESLGSNREAPLRQWLKKLIEQFEIDTTGGTIEAGKEPMSMSEERATLLYLIDVYSKNLFEIDAMPVRKARETWDEYAKALVDPKNPDIDKTLFRLRQFFSTYRIDEYAYLQKTFDDFKGIIWDFADQLGEDIRFEKDNETVIRSNLNQLREAVESNSIDTLRTKSREFIDFYVEFQSRKDERRSQRMNSIRKNLSNVKKQLTEATQTLKMDHLTGAANRRSFDEQAKRYAQMADISGSPLTMIMLDIDHFKKINDSYGHDIGDFVLKECVHLLKEVFQRNEDLVARLGGEEFCVVLPGFSLDHATRKAEEAMSRIRHEVFVQGDLKIRFTVSMGIAQRAPDEPVTSWLKRADLALYEAKNSGRNKYVHAAPPGDSKVA